jgi:hypothetical protein
MATLDSLADDQRAVLQLVLGRRRGYEEIASMLSIAPGAVRDRAVGALDALAPTPGLDDGTRRLVCDYLLSQLSGGEADEARQLLASSPRARDWALALTPALEPVAVDPLPRIPPPDPAPQASRSATGASGSQEAPRDPAGGPPSSRRGGLVVIGLALAVIIAAVVVLLVTDHPHRTDGSLAAATHTSGTATSTGTGTGTGASTSTTTSSSTSAIKYLAQINLRPVAGGSKAVAIAEILEQQGVREIAIIGQHIPPNTKRNSYEVWLYRSPTRFEKLGFVSPAVGKAGTFSDARRLPADASRYRQLIVTTETAQKPTHPGPVLLRGTITSLS